MTSLRVVVRIRPFKPHDNEPANSLPAVQAVADNNDESESASSVPTILSINDKQMQFDRVFPLSTSQNEVYMDVAYPLIQSVLEGINACVFAFGNTGAGKSYSMLGPEGGRRSISHTQDGILPRVASELFRRIARMEAETRDIQMSYTDSSTQLSPPSCSELSSYQVRVQFLEIYRENVFDLLGGQVSADRDPSSSVSLREDTSSGEPIVFAQNATEIRVTSTEQLLDLVRQGAKARTTAATGVHAHSSRSHALLILAVERRWRSVKNEIKGNKVNTRTSRFTLVDLAGAESMEASHGGEVDKAGTATNIGLLVLGRVITALAENSVSSSLTSHVPYRDSSLTRLMQSSLSGSAQTVMLACVSPSNKEANFTCKNLQYALSARNVALRPKTVDIMLESTEIDPMFGDHEDENQLLNRRCIMIECGTYGDVFARCIGNAADPLIVYIHGSGPKNSSMVWNECAQELQERINKNSPPANPKGFFHVAIDCPGYGRSTNGSKQTIRSYPSSFLQSLIKGLGRLSAVCVVGSSQGAAAALNAALELPDMIHAVAVCHPVCHAPLERFSRLEQPVLMAYDISDDGHPVSVGRILRKYISYGNGTSESKKRDCRYFEFDSISKANTQEKDWLRLNFAKELHSLLCSRWKDIGRKRLGGRRVENMPDLSRVAGGVVKWGERYNGEVLPWYGANEESTKENQEQQQLDNDNLLLVTEDEDVLYSDAENTWKVVLDAETSLVLYENMATGRRVKIRPTIGKVLVHKIAKATLNETGEEAAFSLPSNQDLSSLFSDSNNPNSPSDFETEDEKKERLENEKEEQRRNEAAQKTCDLCKKPLFFGRGLTGSRLPRCRCALCACCVERTILYTRQCPKCGDGPLKVGKNRVVVTEEIVENLDDSGNSSPEEPIDSWAIQLQSSLLRELQIEKDGSKRVVIEYGNSAKKLGSKTSFTTFVKMADMGQRKDLRTSVDIQKVDFSINPGYIKPTASVRKNDNARTSEGDTGYNPKTRTFSFEYAMGRRYPCFLTIYLEGGMTSSGRKVQIQKIELPYYVQNCDTVFKRRLILQFPSSNNGVAISRKSVDLNQFLCDPDDPKEKQWGTVWIRFGNGEQGVNVEYLPEGDSTRDMSLHYGRNPEGKMESGR